MLYTISLYTGMIVLSIIAIIIIIMVGIAISYLLRKPWYFIKHLMPWKWVTEKEWKYFENYCKKSNLSKEEIGMYTKRRGRFGTLAFPNDKKWYNPKNHLFYIKRD